jgi:hypoxanthine phosphoribosyltransferase
MDKQQPSEDRPIAVLFGADQIAARVGELAREIADELGQHLMVVAVLKGSFVFTADLMRALHQAGMRPQIDFMTLSSYGRGTQSSGHVQINRDITDPVEGLEVVLVDDILESGRTLAFAKRELLERGASKVKVCVLLDKAGHRKTDLEADFVGFQCPDRFVVGYGLDFAHYYRELPYIGFIEQS